MVDFFLKSVDERRYLFYIEISTLQLHDFLMKIFSVPRYPWGTLGTRLISKKKKLFELANFSASNRLRGNFITVKNCLQQRKNPYLTKLVSKWKRALRKGYANFLVFLFLDLKLVPIDSALNSASCNLTHFFENVGVLPRKASKLKKSGLKFFWNVFCDL